MLSLYHSPYSTCSQKVRLCLWEKNLPFEVIELKFWEHEHLKPEYLKLNPNGVVPTLIHDDRPIIDSSVIVEYLDEVFPDVPLGPTDFYERAKMRAWLRFLEEVPTVAIRVPSFNKVFVNLWSDKSDEEIEHQAETRPLRKQFYKEMGRKGFDAAKLDDSIERLKQTIIRMNDAMEDQNWLCGPNISLADMCVIPTIDRMRDLGLHHVWQDYPNVVRWWNEVQKRNSYKQTFYKGTRVSERYKITD